MPAGLTLGLGLLALPLAAQTTVTLGKPEAEFPEPFTRLRSIAELGNGRVLATDLQDKVVELVDFGSRTAVKVGREGQGPGEWAMPGALFPLPDGRVLLHDLLNRRFLPIDQSGKTGDAIPMPGGPGAGPFGILFGPGGGGVDGKGRLYFQAPPIVLRGGRPETTDSMAILRWSPAGPAVDTVAWIRAPKSGTSASGDGGRFMVRYGGGKVFTPAEAWGVAADGSIARVVPSPFQVIWYPAGGKPVSGPAVPYTPIKVTETDRARVIEQQKKQKPVMIAIGPGGRQPPPPSAGNVQIPPPEFEDTKPPFTGPDAVLVAPEGEVWVLRSRPAADQVPAYDVFGRSGRIVRRVALLPGSRIVGFGKGTVYAVRTDDEDLEYLQRFKR